MSSLDDDDDDDNDEDPGNQSFWTFVRRTRKYSLDTETEERIDKRQKVVCRIGYGISYEWITEPVGWSSLYGPNWYSADGIFEGVNLSEFERVLGRFREEEIKNEKEKDDDDRPYKHMSSRLACIPDHLFKDSCLPTPQEMAGEYDIIYYGGELCQFFGRHNRTARGTLQLSSVMDEDKGKLVTAGSVTMHHCMDQIDIIPFGGNYKFMETSRIQRQGQGGGLNGNHYPGDTTLPTGVINVKATDPPDGVSYRGMRVQDENMFRGEIRIFREKIGAGIVDQTPIGMWSEEYPRRKCKFKSTQEAEELNRAHYSKTCSRLHKHTCLNQLAASKVGKFVSPPPVFFFEKGDIQIDMDWPSIAGGHHNANSCIIARRRRPASGAPSGPGLLVTDDNKYEKEMRSVQAEIGRLEKKKDLIWLAYKCSKMMHNDRHSVGDDDDSTPHVTFPYDNERVKRCLVYMNVDFFNEQLSLYGLRLEQKQLVPGGQHSFYQLDFSRIYADQS